MTAAAATFGLEGVAYSNPLKMRLVDESSRFLVQRKICAKLRPGETARTRISYSATLTKLVFEIAKLEKGQRCYC